MTRTGDGTQLYCGTVIFPVRGNVQLVLVPPSNYLLSLVLLPKKPPAPCGVAIVAFLLLPRVSIVPIRLGYPNRLSHKPLKRLFLCFVSLLIRKLKFF